MTSPAHRHYLRMSAARASARPADDTAPVRGTQYELMLAKLAEDKRRLKLVQSVERKAEVKREVLPDYAPWVDGVLGAGQGAQDDVLMTVMVWRIDAGDFVGALPIAAYAITHKLTMPDQYERTTACLIAEEFADMALKAWRAKTPIDVESLNTVEQLTRGEDMPDQVRAKLHKAIGYGLSAGDQAGALTHLRRALELDSNVGVKKDIERLERETTNAAKNATTGGGKPAARR